MVSKGVAVDCKNTSDSLPRAGVSFKRQLSTQEAEKQIGSNPTPSELKAFIGGLPLSATCPLPNKRKYWSSEDNVPKLLANSMRRDRFIDMLQNIHFHDNTLEANDRAKRYRVHGLQSRHVCVGYEQSWLRFGSSRVLSKTKNCSKRKMF
ncbi:unnamed protein product [Lepeophtheirus salmonis]|uniref:(salmon louse) hypothetical protein n=1 Tax=Lepeophtheirus salmonis TaxID=72036 RepID=A0A7R8CBW6_LEPSM|nr:unnamed protein product [Lepeophtheirus salmonis]CAF2764955.1 unnamed protein product [Lepeophtheirus salmonis]